MPVAMITQTILRERLVYDPETGTFTFIAHRDPKRIGMVADYRLDTHGYRVLIIKKTQILAHRAVFVYLYGVAPKEVDHINGIRTDNRLINLRSVQSRSENLRNACRHIDNISGVTGVSFKRTYTTKKKWTARIIVNYKEISLGTFLTKEEAVAARKEGEVKYGFHPNHGRDWIR